MSLSTSFEVLRILIQIPGNIDKINIERRNLRKYATHLFTTPLSNVIFDNMMSRLIITLTKQFFDNQFTHFKIKT